MFKLFRKRTPVRQVLYVRMQDIRIGDQLLWQGVVHEIFFKSIGEDGVRIMFAPDHTGYIAPTEVLEETFNPEAMLRITRLQ